MIHVVGTHTSTKLHEVRARYPYGKIRGGAGGILHAGSLTVGCQRVRCAGSLSTVALGHGVLIVGAGKGTQNIGRMRVGKEAEILNRH